MMNGYGGIGGMGVGGSLLMIVVLVAVVVLAVWIVRDLVPGTPAGPASMKPLDVLKQRYAAGEIGDAEYERARRAIE